MGLDLAQHVQVVRGGVQPRGDLLQQSIKGRLFLTQRLEPGAQICQVGLRGSLTAQSHAKIGLFLFQPRAGL